jgi:hypothetical protein
VLDDLLTQKEIELTTVEVAKEVVTEIDIQTRNKILHQGKQKIQENKLDEASFLLLMFGRYFLTDIFIF